jgi:dTDP-4-dehydrorhamnose 3,5-epimerase-like enzyme
MKIAVSEAKIDGCCFARLSGIEDSRGSFTKLFHHDTISKYLPNFTAREMYLTSSTKGVLRGMHFQIPPHDHQKIVICLEGSVIDVILDLRKGENY